jgi:hypothetical protein
MFVTTLYFILKTLLKAPCGNNKSHEPSAVVVIEPEEDTLLP